MTKRVQILRHTGTDSGNFVGREGEVTGDTTNKKLRFHDGQTPGGVPVAREDLANVADATTTVAGKMSATDKAKLDGIQAGAQVNLDAAGIKSAYESNANTNAFTDANKQDVETDLPSGIAANATNIATNAAALIAHTGDTNNPHAVTKIQLGLKQVVESEVLAGADTDDAYVTAALLKSIIRKLAGHLGDHKWGYYDSANLPDGWILGYDGSTGATLSVGNAASGATYAGDQYQALFNRIYARCNNTNAPISGGTRTDAATDWAANKTLSIPNFSGRSPIATNPASHDSLSVRAPGAKAGEEAHLLTSAESGLQAHAHSYNGPAGSWTQGQVDVVQFPVGNAWHGSTTRNTNNSAASNASSSHNTMHPVLALDMIICYRD